MTSLDQRPEYSLAGITKDFLLGKITLETYRALELEWIRFVNGRSKEPVRGVVKRIKLLDE